MKYLLLLLFLFWLPCQGIEVTKTSACAAKCNGGGTTLNSNIVCKDRNYNLTQSGRTMKNCLLCESTSTAYKTATDNNLYWFLYNQQRILQRCLYQLPSRVSALPKCESECATIRSVLALNWNVTEHEGIPQYRYCNWRNETFPRNVAACSSCLGGVAESVYLSNFLDNLETACKTKPNLLKGNTLELSQPLFYTPWPYTPKKSKTGLSTGAKAGIGVGAGVGGLALITAAACLFKRRKKQPEQAPEPEAAMGNDRARGDDQKHELPPADYRQSVPPSELSTGANQLELSGNPLSDPLYLPKDGETKSKNTGVPQSPPSELP